MGGGLIPKLRPLFCRVPKRGFSRTSEDTLLIHLCWFPVRILYTMRDFAFLGPLSPCLELGLPLTLATYIVHIDQRSGP